MMEKIFTTKELLYYKLFRTKTYFYLKQKQTSGRLIIIFRNKIFYRAFTLLVTNEL